MDDRVYVVPPDGDGSASVPEESADHVSTSSAADFQEEVSAKLDAILAALGISQEGIG